ADRRENLCRKKAQNRRNTFCIARFCNAFVGQIGRQDVRGELCGDALNIPLAVRLICFPGRPPAPAPTQGRTASSAAALNGLL
ncbi:hypothetical protein, partial [Lawsonibacter sp.]|uniref:hypothetical protein n=1 Tax=Lawsonibacter sp. TaxID=2185275 RepID=UPI00258BE137